MTAAGVDPDPHREWRELVAFVLCGIAAFTVYGALGPTRVHLVDLPMTGPRPDSFGLEDWGLLLGAFLAAMTVAHGLTLIVERRRPRRPSLRLRGRRSQKTDWTFVAGVVTSSLANLLYGRPTRGLFVFDEHHGAFIWAPPDLASYGIWLLALLGIGVALARMVQTLRRRRRPIAGAVVPAG